MAKKNKVKTRGHSKNGKLSAKDERKKHLADMIARVDTVLSGREKEELRLYWIWQAEGICD